MSWSSKFKVWGFTDTVYIDYFLSSKWLIFSFFVYLILWNIGHVSSIIWQLCELDTLS